MPEPPASRAARTEAERKARQERAAAALRENLRRRKEQARAREQAARSDKPGEPPQS